MRGRRRSVIITPSIRFDAAVEQCKQDTEELRNMLLRFIVTNYDEANTDIVTWGHPLNYQY